MSFPADSTATTLRSRRHCSTSSLEFENLPLDMFLSASGVDSRATRRQNDGHGDQVAPGNSRDCLNAMSSLYKGANITAMA